MLVSSCWVPPQVSGRLHRSMQTTLRPDSKSVSGLVDTGAHQLDTAGAHQLRGKLSLKGTALMTALLDFPTTTDLQVRGESALVPGTSLRLPLVPEVASLPADGRCNNCAGTGVMRFDGALESCVCVEPEPVAAHTLRPGERVIKVEGGILRPVLGGFPHRLLLRAATRTTADPALLHDLPRGPDRQPPGPVHTGCPAGAAFLPPRSRAVLLGLSHSLVRNGAGFQHDRNCP